MSLIKAKAGQFKSEFVVTNPAAGGVTVDASELIVWIGSLLTDIPNARMAVVTGVGQCLDAIREAGSPTPGTGFVTEAEASPYLDDNILLKRDITVVTGGTLTTPSSNGITVAYGELFQPTNNGSITDAVKQCLQVYLEQIGKKLAA